VGSIIPEISGSVHKINLMNVRREMVFEAIKSTYFMAIVIQTSKIKIGEIIDNDINNFLKIYLKAIERTMYFPS
jgi:hypothetical protein